MISKNTVLIILLVFTIFLGSTTVYYSVINPGFEGAKCNFYGLYVAPGGTWDGYDGAGLFHAYHDAEPYLAQKDQKDRLHLDSIRKTLYWSGLATPNDAGIGYLKHNYDGLTTWQREYPSFQVHVENNVQLQDITKQGDPDPLDWNDQNPLEGRRIEYWSKKGTKITETEESVTYQYTLEKNSFLITPAEFWVGFYLNPAQDQAHTSSTWREGEYEDLTAWFRLDFHVWDNAYYDDWMMDPEDEVYTTEYDGVVISKERKMDPDWYRGGFPICGWIQGWEKAGWTSDPYAGEQQSPLWYSVRGGETSEKTDLQLADIRDKLMAKVSFSPDMEGTMISLYDEPDVSFDYVQPSYTGFDNTDKMTGQVQTPDTSMKKVMYFPININNFGTLAQERGWWGLTGWKVYYPSAYFRVRMIYGVYGTFKYLWTEEVTKPFFNETSGQYEGGLDYPETFERKGTTVITTRGPLSPFEDLTTGLGGWWGNPLNQLWTLFGIMVIIIILVTVLNPGVWSSLAKVVPKTGRKKTSRRRGFKK